MVLKIVLFFLACFLVISHRPFPQVIAQDGTADLQNKIEEYTKKLDELAKAKDTLSNQIKILDSQVSLTLLKISQTESNIKSLESDISSLTVKIQNLDIYLNRLSLGFINQVSEVYKLQKKSPFLSIFLSNKFNSFLEQYKYLSVVQKTSRNTLLDMETTRTSFNLQKEEKKKKQIELELLEKKLADQKTSLSKQKTSKSGLLEITKNDESKYQQLKKAAEQELSSLLAAKFVGKRNVKKGEAIGTMGNTGYSFGDHLHFGLYDLREEKLSDWVYVNDSDPVPYLDKYSRPLNDPLEITQGRGQTKYSYLYADRFHHGIDMVSPNKTVSAVNEGVAYFFRNPSSSLGNHVKVFHPDGKMTLYLHLQ